jgi:hypothetical protein
MLESILENPDDSGTLCVLASILEKPDDSGLLFVLESILEKPDDSGTLLRCGVVVMLITKTWSDRVILGRYESNSIRLRNGNV